MIENLIKQNRTCRRFYQDDELDLDTLKSLTNLGRLSASAANLQPLKYVLCTDPSVNSKIFDCLAWAGYLKEWPSPKEGERPSGYIIMLGDTRITRNFMCDHGIAAQSIMLGAREKGLGGCMLGAINIPKLRKRLNIADHFEVLLVLALGKPKEEVAIDAIGPDGDVKYWRDKQEVHHVPKRQLEDIIIDTY